MIVFKTLRIADCEDPEIYAAAPIIEWQHTDEGAWVMKHAVETPSYRIRTCPDTWGYVVDIYGQLNEADEVFYRLKYDVQSSHR
jgi:hypothetical protein